MDTVLIRPPHILVNILCLVLVELDIVLLMSTPSAGATVLQENQRSFASVVCVWLEANGNVCLEEGFILLEISLFRPETSLKNDQVSLTPDNVTCGVILLL